MEMIGHVSMVEINNTIERKIVSIFLSISFNICFGCSKEPSHVLTFVLGAQKNPQLSLRVLLSTRNLYFG